MNAVRRTARRRWIAPAAVWALALGAGGCQVEWGGGSIALEDPAPPADTAAVDVELEPQQVPLPEGPFLHLVRPGPDGSVRLTPLAALGAGSEPLADLVFAAEEDPTFRSRFDSAFLAPGRELELLARGGRMGTVVLTGLEGGSAPACPTVASGRALVPPGQDLPDWAFALPAGAAGAAAPRRIQALEVRSSMAVAGPVLAERLIGGERAFLARRAAMAAVELPSDTLPGMVATYLIADSLAAGPPGEDAVSLFFMARFEPARGYLPLWEEVRRYGSAEEKEAFEYLDWIPLGEARLDALRRHDARSTRLALAWTAGDSDPEIAWIEPAGCPALGRLEAGG